MKAQILRCAVYTRKSSEEGLEQDFNSLHAQREACVSYIQSQKNEGWKLLATHYDDGGYSGGTLERPALRQLFADIEAGSIDLVVVYKVDRLTRSLTDFAKIVERFDAKQVSFVSVTQAFNTTTSMGRLTLNVLLSFAQFEREVTGERIRDKIAASKRKGLWMGGVVPLGYAVRDRRLVIADTEAAQVRHIFERYTVLANVDAVRRELIKSESRGRGRSRGGQRASSVWSNGALTRILTNPLYRGWISHRGELHSGQHEAIVTQELWDRVQSVIATRKRENTSTPRARGRNPLLGLLTDNQHRTFYASYTKKPGHLPYRYYVTKCDNQSKQLRLPAGELERHVDAALTAYLGDRQRLVQDFSLTKEIEVVRITSVALKIASAADAERWISWRKLVKRVTYTETKLRIQLDPLEVQQVFNLEVMTDCKIEIERPTLLHRVGNDIRLVIPAIHGNPEAAKLDSSLINFVARGRRWYKQLTSGERSLTNIARSEQVTVTYVARLIRGSLLAPDIVQRILAGRQPINLTVEALSVPIPADWDTQRRHFGI